MSRLVLALVLVCSLASAAHAGRFCVQIDEGTYAGSQIVLKRARLAPGNVASLEGYLARYSPSQLGFNEFHAIYGGSIVSSAGTAALSLTFHSVYVVKGGFGSGTGDPVSMSLVCSPGGDGKLNVLDSCFMRVPGGSQQSSHVVDCVPEAAVP